MGNGWLVRRGHWKGVNEWTAYKDVGRVKGNDGK